jgi:hypothetical protein
VQPRFLLGRHLLSPGAPQAHFSISPLIFQKCNHIN